MSSASRHRRPPGAEQVAKVFRRVLSGAEDGRPSWVRALEQPGDAGWFGPGSAVWEVHGSLATLVGGVRALLLQAAHPLALAGVEQHSDYRTDPLGRLQRTNLFVTTTTYGSTAQAETAVRTVRRVHESVVGHAPDGRAYAANDPHLLLWVHVGLADSMLRAALAFGPKDIDPDAYVGEMATIAQALGVPDPPATVADLDAALEAFRPELTGGPAAEEVVRFLSRPPLPTGAQPVYQVFHRAAVALLPPWAPELLGTPLYSPQVAAAHQATASGLLRGLRLVLGTTSPGERAALGRLAAADQAVEATSRTPSEPATSETSARLGA